MRRIIGTIGATLAIVGVMGIVNNWIPLESPAGGPYFGKLDPAASVKIDKTGDGVTYYTPGSVSPYVQE